MSKENTAKKPVDLNDVEMVFGTPEATKRDIKPDVHITNEKNGKESKHVSPRPEQDAESALATQPLLEAPIARQNPPLADVNMDMAHDRAKWSSMSRKAEPGLSRARRDEQLGQSHINIFRPEIDDLEGDAPSAPREPFPGIDDGLLEEERKHGEDHPEEKEGNDEEMPHDEHGEGENTDDGKLLRSEHGVDETDFYYDGHMPNGIHNRFGEDRPGSPMVPSIIPDVNTYQQKKNLAQGMMDLALLSANANQLRYVIESASTHNYYYPNLVFITCSIILQVAVGVGLIMNSRYDVKDEKEICKADKINNMTVLGIFIITIVNVFITSFSVSNGTNTSIVTNQTRG